MEDRNTDDRNIAAEVKDQVAAGFGLSPDPEIPVNSTEKDEDALVHETAIPEDNAALKPAADLDDLVHEQPPAPPAINAEKDIDDLLH